MLKDVTGGIVGERGLGSTAYEHDFFSGSQVALMIGDVLIDSAVHLSVQLDQQKRPIYGYANQYYSFLGDGPVVVQGNLTIAFKEAGYLLYALKRFSDFANATTWQSPRYKISKDGLFSREVKGITAETKFENVAKEARRKKTMRLNVEQMMEWQKVANKPNVTKQERNGARYQNNRLVKQLGALQDDAFEDWAETFEDSLWYGTDIQNSFMRDKVNSKNFRSDEKIDDESVFSHRRADQYPAFDMWIVYGDTNNHAANHTVQKILDASFLGVSKTIQVSGEPVYESYPFIARNLV